MTLLSLPRPAAFGLVAAALAAPSASPAAPAPLAGAVGPGFTISLAQAGKQVTTLRAGTYRVTVHDRSASHDFRLRGPGVDREITSVYFTGVRSATVTLRKGTYRIVCGPHAAIMHGAFSVG